MKKIIISFIAFLVGSGSGIFARETASSAVPTWYVDLTRMIVDQVEEYLSTAADTSLGENRRRGNQGVLGEFFVGYGDPYYIADEYFDPVSVKSYDPSVEKTYIMPYKNFFDEISTKDWLYKINFELVGADYYVMEVESVEDLGDNEVLCTGPVYKMKLDVNRDKSLRVSKSPGIWENASVRCEKKLYDSAPEVKVGETLFLGLGDIYVIEVEVK